MLLIQNYLTKNDCYKANRRIAPKGIMVHSTGANNPTLKRYVQPDIQGIGKNTNNNDWNRSGIGACVHAFIGKRADGSIATVQTLPWNWRGWHGGKGTKGSVNNTHISFEICEDGLTDRTYFLKVYQEAVELTAYLCRMYALDPLKDGVVICHSEGYKCGIASNHGDVMHWFPKHGKSMDTFRRDVYNLLTKKPEEEKEDEEDMTVERFTELFLEMRKDLQDNDAGAWSKEARDWAVEPGLVQGTSGGTFNGAWEDLLTREQLVTVLYRFAKMMDKA